ncbi:MAG: hypothetical protein KDA05_05680 [Phycisphaerales bacterium]|nr:hypothetical protein [Phycisphaerales bacterium]
MRDAIGIGGVRGIGAWVAIGVLAGAACAQPEAATPYIARHLYDHSLHAEPVLLHRIDGSMMTYTDARGLLRRAPTSEFLVVLPAPSQIEPVHPDGDAPEGVVTLVDGQRYTGRALATPDADEPPLLWHAPFGTIRLALEHVASVARLGAEAPSASGEGEDRVRLSNGDTLTGFLLEIGERVAIETAAGEVDVPFAAVSWARIANPPVEPRGVMVWLDDGTVARVEILPQATPDALETRVLLPGAEEGTSAAIGVRTEDESAPVNTGPRLSIPVASIRALVFDASRLVGLGELDLVGVRSDRPWPPSVGFSNTDANPLGAPDITLPVPLSASWALPPRAERVAFEASLPERSRIWGDAMLVLTVEQDQGAAELGRFHLHAGSPTASVNVPIPLPEDPRRDRRLRVDFLGGDSGPAQDAVVLRYPLVLLGPE